MTAPVTDVSVYSDLNGLNKLKQGAQAQDPKAIREAARQFESVFARMMLKSMRDANFKDPNFGSDQEEFYQGMFDDQLSVELTKGHGLGLADMLVQQLTKAGLVPPGAAAKNLTATHLAPASPAATNQAPTSATADITTAASGATTSFDTANAIDSFDPTNAAAAGGTGSDPSSLTTQAAFVRALWPFAQAAGQALGTDPRNIVAQAALETGWGRAVPADGSGRSSHNLFGIKAGSQWVGPSVGARTLEFSDGVPSARVDKFRAYGSATDSFQDYVKLLSGNPRYSGALNTGADTSAFASALQRGGYSTDPAYAHKLTAIAQNVTGMTVGLKSAAAEPIHLTATIL